MSFAVSYSLGFPEFVTLVRSALLTTCLLIQERYLANSWLYSTAMRVWLACVLCTLGMMGALSSASGQDRSSSLAGLGVYRDTVRTDLPQPFVLRPFLRKGTEAIYVAGSLLDTTRYQLDHRYGRLWIPDLAPGTSVVAVYRTWGFALQDTYRNAVARRDSAVTDSARSPDVRITAPERTANGVNLRRSGSITRGILAGNNRDAIVESGLRLRMDGQIADGVSVQAVLTDESTPILPEGTTQRLNEFDRVFIEIDVQYGAAQLGDFDVRYETSEFARFARKVQGIGLRASPAGSSILSEGAIAVMGATARGMYRSQDITIADGIQGPYRLTGANGERFIFVVPGSEIVYVDGARVTRGQSNDYVIDYATGEVTFTSNRLIREDNRVLVEFQYRTTKFTRTLLGAETDVAFGQRSDGSARGRFGATFIREADARTFSQELGLTEDDRQLLASVGDQPAVRSGAAEIAYEAEAPYVQYILRDTLVSGAREQIYEAVSAPPAGPVYRVHFSHVGTGNGSYVREGHATNGILYVWHGRGRGSYDPVRLLPKPSQQRMLDLRGGFEPFRRLEIFGEWARSMHDKNRLSDLDAGDDQASAWTAGLRLKPWTPTLQGIALGELSGHMRRRFTGDHFATFNRIRPVEFARTWNLDERTVAQGGSTVQVGREIIEEANMKWLLPYGTRVTADIGRIQLADSYRGSREEVALDVVQKRLPTVSLRRAYIRSTDAVLQEDGSWLRQRGRLEQSLIAGHITAHVEVEQEHRRQRRAGTDSLSAASLAFIEYRPGLTFGAGASEAGVLVEVRTEDLWADGALRDGSRSVTIETNFDTKPVGNFRTEGRLGLRKRTYSDFFRSERQLQDRQSVVMRWTGRWQPWRRALYLDWLYEALTERTPTLQEVYIRTGPELGEYVWEDANGDGVVQIDEFLPERIQDAGTYARTLIPSDSLQSVIGVQTRFTLRVDPARLWRTSTAAWKRRLSNVYARTNIQIQEKSRNPDLAQVYLLRLSQFRSSVHTLKGRLRFQQDLILFRNQPRYGLNLSYYEAHSLNELAAGTETRLARQWKVEGRLKPTDAWAMRLTASAERNKTQSEAFSSRTYDIRSVTIVPEVAFSPTGGVQLVANFSYSRKSENTRVWKVPVTARYALARRLNMTMRAEVASVVMDRPGLRTGLAQFELTDGRGPGTSFLWSFNAWYQISAVLRATAAYNGRKPAQTPAIHTMRLSMSAMF